ncbi:MAG: rhodanese-like domain-containing protein [Methylococcales symbiont of Hymedesmia sp. n. MRB-2018]|nr:MAG: rhodanese-like domain-containing protein [Methylococcales symbiont of Hymedesmia sp. n. MRB-2018]KAF3984359.1 MAG: rhodanese-like domain-containing protein [Methylococcales symbiont of Hymedesmia sp. n. MRB-2018]
MDQYLEFIGNHYLLCLALVIISFLLIQDLVESAFNKFEGLSPLLAVTKMNAADTVIVDVRVPHEYKKGHIEDAINIPVEKFSEQVASLEKYKQQAVIVVCKTGNRANSACKTLVRTGFEHVFNIVGGMQSWEDSNLPVKTASKDKK